jgi:L-iditol 2-dehydrogenase
MRTRARWSPLLLMSHRSRWATESPWAPRDVAPAEPVCEGRDKGCPEHFAYFSLKGGELGPGGFLEYKVHREDGCFPVGDAPFELACLAETTVVRSARCAPYGYEGRRHRGRLWCRAYGLLNAMVLQHAGVDVALVDMEQERLDYASSHGIRKTILSSGDAVDSILEEFPGGVDGVVTAIGSNAVNQQGFKVLQPPGNPVSLCVGTSC